MKPRRVLTILSLVGSLSLVKFSRLSLVSKPVYETEKDEVEEQCTPEEVGENHVEEPMFNTDIEVGFGEVDVVFKDVNDTVDEECLKDCRCEESGYEEL